MPTGGSGSATGRRIFGELFETRPDVYLAVCAPPCRPLTDTGDAIRWNAGKEEHFTLEIAREDLGDLSPQRPDDEVEGGFSLDRGALTIGKRDGFAIPRLPGFRLGGTHRCAGPP